MVNKQLRVVLWLIAVMIVGLAGAVHAQGRWVKQAAFPEPSEELVGAAANGKLYVFGGYETGGKPKGVIYEYDPASDQWTKKKNMMQPAHHMSIVEHGGKFYVIGGFVVSTQGPPSWVPINNAWQYDPAADTWKALAAMPSRRGGGNAGVVGEKIYVIGGATNAPGESGLRGGVPQQVVGTVEEYDITNDTWRARSAMPTPRNHGGAGVINNKIYVVGGRIGAAWITMASNTDAVEEYDPATDKWSSLKARMPTARSGGASSVWRGRVVFAGGEFQDSRMMAAFRAVEAYDPITNSWSTLPSMPNPRHGLAGAIIGNRLHLVSGDLQSAGTGHNMHSDAHDVFEFDAK